MKRLYLALLLLISTILGFASFRSTHAFFNDTSTSANNIFAAVSVFPTPTVPIAQTLVINELLPHSSCISGGTEGQYLELWNGSGADVNLQNFKLTDGTNTPIAIANSNTTLPNGAFAILVKSNGVITQCLGNNVNGAVTVNLGGQIDLNTGTLQLLDSSDVVIDTAKWGNGQTLQPAINQSIERVPTGKDSATGVNFNAIDFIIKEVVTPGYGTTLVVNELVSHVGVTFPDEIVEIFNPGNTAINVTGWSLQDASNTNKSMTSIGIISAHGFATVTSTSGWLNDTGDTIRIRDNSNRIIDVHTFGSSAADKSIGRQTDGTESWKSPCNITTIGLSNNGGC